MQLTHTDSTDFSFHLTVGIIDVYFVIIEATRNADIWDEKPGFQIVLKIQYYHLNNDNCRYCYTNTIIWLNSSPIFRTSFIIKRESDFYHYLPKNIKGKEIWVISSHCIMHNLRDKYKGHYNYEPIIEPQIVEK